MEKILVPTDFSEQAYNAVLLASELARRNSASIQLVHVVEYPASSSFNALGTGAMEGVDNAYLLDLMENVKQQMEDLLKDPILEGIVVSSDIRVGNPFTSISSDIASADVDLVVMGTQGSSGIEETLLGSNAEKVVRLSKCPVITVKDKVNIGQIKNIAFATSLRDNHAKLIHELKKLQETFNATLHIVRVNTPNNFANDREVRGLMNELVTKYNLSDYTINIYNDVSEEDGIIFFCEDNKVDMIAIATHGRTGIMHILSGSIAEDVVNHAKRPVWTFNLKNQ